jgi:hypothetical protein
VRDLSLQQRGEASQCYHLTLDQHHEQEDILQPQLSQNMQKGTVEFHLTERNKIKRTQQIQTCLHQASVLHERGRHVLVTGTSLVK